MTHYTPPDAQQVHATSQDRNTGNPPVDPEWRPCRAQSLGRRSGRVAETPPTWRGALPLPSGRLQMGKPKSRQKRTPMSEKEQEIRGTWGRHPIPLVNSRNVTQCVAELSYKSLWHTSLAMAMRDCTKASTICKIKAKKKSTQSKKQRERERETYVEDHEKKRWSEHKQQRQFISLRKQVQETRKLQEWYLRNKDIQQAWLWTLQVWESGNHATVWMSNGPH